MHQIQFRLGVGPRPSWESLQLDLRGLLLSEGRGRGEEWEGKKDGEGKGGEWKDEREAK